MTYIKFPTLMFILMSVSLQWGSGLIYSVQWLATD